MREEKIKFVFLCSVFVFVASQKLCDRRYLNDDIRIDGKVVIITGGTSGLGFEAARNLAGRGGKIYLASRNEEKGDKAVEFIRNSTSNENVHFLKLDLASLDSVGEFSKKFHLLENRLDILINNAGVVMPYKKTKDGFELNMGINHLGHFLLTNLLLDLLKVAAPSRIVVVSSVLHYIGFIDRRNLNSELLFYGIFKTYGTSKLANVLFTRELARRLEGTGVTVNSLDPGPSMSNVFHNLSPSLQSILVPIQQTYWRPPAHATQSHIFLAVDPSVEHVSGGYFLDCVRWFTHPQSYDDDLARWLWNKSSKLTKLYSYEKITRNSCE